MRRIRPDTYECSLCGAIVEVSGDARPVVMMAAQSGEPNVRVVTVEGVEVHRCVIADASGTTR